MFKCIGNLARTALSTAYYGTQFVAQTYESAKSCGVQEPELVKVDRVPQPNIEGYDPTKPFFCVKDDAPIMRVSCAFNEVMHQSNGLKLVAVEHILLSNDVQPSVDLAKAAFLEINAPYCMSEEEKAKMLPKYAFPPIKTKKQNLVDRTLVLADKVLTALKSLEITSADALKQLEDAAHPAPELAGQDDYFSMMTRFAADMALPTSKMADDAIKTAVVKAENAITLLKLLSPRWDDACQNMPGFFNFLIKCYTNFKNLLF